MTAAEKLADTNRLRQKIKTLVLEDEDDEEGKENTQLSGARLPAMTPNSKKLEIQKKLKEMKDLLSTYEYCQLFSPQKDLTPPPSASNSNDDDN